ncbi:MAG TPA: histidine phosphatase family protein [Mariprofundaceae bacterium]|nr:histidine phosphatase family protein [Mariprofundaceae bacterium]
MRKILVIRHAIALDRVEAAHMSVADAERPLTKDGWKRMRGIVEGLQQWVPELHIVATSPWLRAVQTAEIVAGAYADAKVKETALLLPGSSHQELLDWLEQIPEKKHVAIVGHEPGLSLWAGWALSGQDNAFFSLKKGGACMIEFGERFAAGQGTLAWLMTAAQLRRSGR